MIVIQCNQYLSEQDYQNLQKKFLKEANEGVVVLPPYCALAGVSEDNEIEFEFEGAEEDE